MDRVNGNGVVQTTLTKDAFSVEIHEINTALQNARDKGKEALLYYKKIGEVLRTIRLRMPERGDWKAWLATNEERLGFGERQARRYVQIAKYWEEVADKDNLTDALEKLNLVTVEYAGEESKRSCKTAIGRVKTANRFKPASPKWLLRLAANKFGTHVDLQELEKKLSRALEVQEDANNAVGNLQAQINELKEPDASE